MKNNFLKIKIEFEDQPILSTQANIKNEKEFDNMIDGFKTKMFGRKR